ncbi:MAG: glycosyltransferase family 4 protein, partial [Nocardioidaceae bacterium]
AQPRVEWQGSEGTVAFVGRLDEPRKGFGLLADAFARVARGRSGVRLLVVGGGDVAAARQLLPGPVRDQVLLLGAVSDEEKAAVLRSADVHVAPNRGGESFGIVLAEAMAAGATVLASDIPAFVRVLGGGRYGALFTSEDPAALARELTALLDDPARRAALDVEAAAAVADYDWTEVAAQIEEVYQTVAMSAARQGLR